MPRIDATGLLGKEQLIFLMTERSEDIEDDTWDDDEIWQSDISERDIE